MRLLLIAALIAGVAWVLLRNVQERRQAWLARLALPGRWQGDQDGVHYRLELSGGLDGGQYQEVNEGPSGRHEEAGSWRLSGNSVVFEPEGGAACSCDLRLFESGRIGLHGPGRERRVYVRQGDNVVMLPRRRG
ncbi:MAG: hypothetical protein EA417_10615 [Gammaproteobacteria bacterium]|nr:MAG: hypothetical protein EA417_10615 [Gammaproteobacteria bacterium]